MTNTPNCYIMSNDMALGFFDADGSVILGVYMGKTSSGNTLCVYVLYLLGQSISKKDAVLKFAEKFGNRVNTNLKTNFSEMRVNQSSAGGQKVRLFLQNNNPKNPYRLRDYLISEEMIPILNKSSKSRVDLLTLAKLASNRAKSCSDGTSNDTFVKYCAHISATKAEIKQAEQIAEQMLLKVEQKLQQAMPALATTNVSDDYALGAHFGDGSLYIGLSWKPTSKSHRLRCEPEWAISGNNQAYCEVFANTFSGTTKPVDEKGQMKFVLGGIKKCLNIISLFDNAPWMPSYKQQQFQRWKDALILLEAQEHFTEKGIKKLLDLTYGLAEKGSRPYTKDQYLNWGLTWVNNPSRQKRVPRGKKP